MKKLLVVLGAIILLIICIPLLLLAIYGSLVLPVERSVGFVPTDLPNRSDCRPIEYDQVVARGVSSPDGKLIAIGTNYGTGIVAAVYDTQTQARRYCLSDNAASPIMLAFSADNQLLAIAHSAGGGMEVWELDSAVHLVFRTVPKNPVLPPIAISPNGKNSWRS